MIRATFDIEPAGVGALLALTTTSGVAGGPERGSARLVSDGAGQAVIDFPVENFAQNDVGLLLAALIGEGMELSGISRCRLVGLEVPEGFLPGPAVGAHTGNDIGVIVKPSVGLGPGEVADIVRAAVAGGARFIKDDEMHTSPPWCLLEDRVSAVASVLEAGVVYCANVSGAAETLVERARRAVDLGATGVMVNPFTHGLGTLVALRLANLGVPIFAHRAGSGAIVRNRRFGATGAVLARLTRLCGADFAIAGAFAGKLFDSEGEVRANLAAIRETLGSTRSATAALGGGIGPGDVRLQAETAGGEGLLLLLGSAAYEDPNGLTKVVVAAREALDDV